MIAVLETYSWFLFVCYLFWMYLLFVTFKYFTEYDHKVPKLSPPGPMGLPFVGYLPLIGKYPHQTIHKLKQKYGDILSLRLGTETVIFLTGYDVIKEAFSQNTFNDRLPNNIFKVIKNPKNFSDENGITWQEHRKFIVHRLGKLSTTEVIIAAEIEHLFERIDGEEGQPLDCRQLIGPFIGNVMSQVLFGKRFDYDDKTRKMIDGSIDTAANYFTQTGLLEFFPTLAGSELGLKLLNIEPLEKAVHAVLNFIRKEVLEHKASFNPNDIRDFTDAYLLEMTTNRYSHLFTEEMLVGDTEVLSWLLLLVANEQEMQKRIYSEIERVAEERGSLITWSDRHLMPFTQAFICETMRWVGPVPLNMVRTPAEDTYIRGYFIPKGIRVIANLWSALRDPIHWLEPDRFKPSRFLSTDSGSDRFVPKNEHLIPFSCGKRRCPGEQVAQMSLFLYFTLLLQRYEVQVPNGSKVSLDTIYSITLKPASKLSFLFINRDTLK